jgi:hypothetical protein
VSTLQFEGDTISIRKIVLDHANVAIEWEQYLLGDFIGFTDGVSARGRIQGNVLTQPSGLSNIRRHLKL